MVVVRRGSMVVKTGPGGVTGGSLEGRRLDRRFGRRRNIGLTRKFSV